MTYDKKSFLSFLSQSFRRRALSRAAILELALEEDPRRDSVPSFDELPPAAIAPAESPVLRLTYLARHRSVWTRGALGI